MSFTPYMTWFVLKESLKQKHQPTVGVLGRPKGDFRLFFRFSATQLARVCLASYQGYLS